MSSTSRGSKRCRPRRRVESEARWRNALITFRTMIKSSLTLLAVVLLAPLDALHAASEGASTKPNILHILADDMGWTALSCFGNKDVATPNLDRLAAQGMRFTNAYADAQCSPTRAACFSIRAAGARSRVCVVKCAA
ncbi:MAG: sulfatase-like hydrolase/transferase [Verrucomicrobiota bacterium]